MPVLNKHTMQDEPKQDIEKTEDYLHFVKFVLNNPVERLLPLQEQMAILNEQNKMKLEKEAIES
jgi:hypothetical protein